MTSLESLIQTVTSGTLSEDFAKAKTGNSAASTRVRKAMQKIKNMAQEIRTEMLSARQVRQ